MYKTTAEFSKLSKASQKQVCEILPSIQLSKEALVPLFYYIVNGLRLLKTKNGTLCGFSTVAQTTAMNVILPRYCGF